MFYYYYYQLIELIIVALIYQYIRNKYKSKLSFVFINLKFLKNNLSAQIYRRNYF